MGAHGGVGCPWGVGPYLDTIKFNGHSVSNACTDIDHKNPCQFRSCSFETMYVITGFLVA